MRFAVIGTGRIAKRFVPECQKVPGTEITVVYNPHEGSAERFVSLVWGQNGGEKKPFASSSLPDIWDMADAVYIASPHETHFGYIMEALRKGKHVLCEKPMFLKTAEAKEAYALSEKEGLILLEGIKTAFCPGYRKLLSLVKERAAGDIRYMEACFTKLEGKEKRELTDTLFGGSFTELGSYVLLPLLDIFGTGYDSIRFESIPDEKGIDIFTKTDIKYGDRFASLTCGLSVKSEGRLILCGTKGYILVPAPWWKTKSIEVHFEDPADTVTYAEEFQGDGLRYEIAEFTGLCREKKKKKQTMLRSIAMADMMERFLLKRRDLKERRRI